MSIKRFILTSDQKTWDECSNFIGSLSVEAGKKYEVVINNDYKRSDEISKLSHVYYRMIAEYMGETPLESKTYCKRKWGLNVLREQARDQTSHGVNAKKVVHAVNKFGYRALCESDQLEFVEILTITSIFTNKSMKSYIQQIEKHFAEENLILKSINDLG